MKPPALTMPEPGIYIVRHRTVEYQPLPVPSERAGPDFGFLYAAFVVGLIVGVAYCTLFRGE